MSFIDISNINEEIRSVIYEILATYNLILLDRRREPLLDVIRKDYRHMEILDLDDKELKSKLSSLFKTQWDVSLEEVIKECNEDDVFSEITNTPTFRLILNH